MGWTYHYNIPRNERAEIEALCTFENEDRACRPIRTSQVGTVWYLAVEVQLKDPTAETYGYDVDAMGRYVFGAVILTSRSAGEWGYKDMDESMGPVEAQAPLALLDLLSPTTKEYALSWRARCRKTAAMRSRRIAHGDTIVLTEPLMFQDGRDRTKFRVEKIREPWEKRASTRFVCLETGVTCRISRFMQRGWVKVIEAIR